MKVTLILPYRTAEVLRRISNNQQEAVMTVLLASAYSTNDLSETARLVLANITADAKVNSDLLELSTTIARHAAKLAGNPQEKPTPAEISTGVTVACLLYEDTARKMMDLRPVGRYSMRFPYVTLKSALPAPQFWGLSYVPSYRRTGKASADVEVISEFGELLVFQAEELTQLPVCAVGGDYIYADDEVGVRTPEGIKNATAVYAHFDFVKVRRKADAAYLIVHKTQLTLI